jgi:hypothetical protein
VSAYPNVVQQLFELIPTSTLILSFCIPFSMTVSQAASAVCSSDRVGIQKTTTYCNAAVADESADSSCLATYPAVGKALNLDSEGSTVAPATLDGHINL